jgi:hypothetical protein
LDAAIVERAFCEITDCGERFERNHPPNAQKNELKPWLKELYCIPPTAIAEFVRHMEDVLDYFDPTRQTNIQHPFIETVPVKIIYLDFTGSLSILCYNNHKGTNYEQGKNDQSQWKKCYRVGFVEGRRK